MSLLVDRIGTLVTWEPDTPVRANAALVISDGRVVWVGDQSDVVEDGKADGIGVERIVGVRSCIEPDVDAPDRLSFK